MSKRSSLASLAKRPFLPHARLPAGILSLALLAQPQPLVPVAAQPLTDRIHHDRIFADVEYQVIENFGASDCWRLQKLGAWSLPARERLADLLFSPSNGIALSCWRFNVGGGINSQITMPWRTVETFEISEGRYDWSRQSNERWFLRAAKARGVPQFLAFVVSPPGRLTRNGLTFTNAGPHTTNLKPGHEGQFARYLADILEHFRTNPGESERIAFDYISPVNEPQWGWEGHTQEGTRASNDDIKRIVQALVHELKRRQLATQVVVLESGNLPDMWSPNAKATAKYGSKFGDYLEEFAGDPAIGPALARRLSYHSYWSDRVTGQLIRHRQQLRRKLDRFPGWRLWQTEYCVMDGPEGKGGAGRDLTMTTGLDVARVIHLDLTLVGVSAWQWWTALSEADYKDGLIYTDWQKPGDAETIYPSKLLWVLGHYSRFVRPGMRRIQLAGAAHDIEGLMGSAYKDEESRRIVAVYVNRSPDAQKLELKFDVGRRSWILDSMTLYVTSDRPGHDLKPYPIDPGIKLIEIPGRSTVTVVTDFRDPW